MHIGTKTSYYATKTLSSGPKFTHPRRHFHEESRVLVPKPRTLGAKPRSLRAKPRTLNSKWRKYHTPRRKFHGILPTKLEVTQYLGDFWVVIYHAANILRCMVGVFPKYVLHDDLGAEYRDLGSGARDSYGCMEC